MSFAGSYTTGTISLAGLAMADDANDAVAFTQTAVTEPGLLAAGAAILAAAWSILRRRRAAVGR